MSIAQAPLPSIIFVTEPKLTNAPSLPFFLETGSSLPPPASGLQCFPSTALVQSSACARLHFPRAAPDVPGTRELAVPRGVSHSRRGWRPDSSPAGCRGTAARRSPPSPSTTRSGRGRCQWFSGTRLRSRRSPAHRWPAKQEEPGTDQGAPWGPQEPMLSQMRTWHLGCL